MDHNASTPSNAWDDVPPDGRRNGSRPGERPATRRDEHPIIGTIRPAPFSTGAIAEYPSGDHPDRLLYADELRPIELRVLARTHVFWLFVSGGCAMAALVLPSSPWYILILRLLLGGASLVLGATRVLQINGIMAELRRRTDAAGLARGTVQSSVAPDAPSAR